MKLTILLVGSWISLASAGALYTQVPDATQESTRGVVIDFQDADLRLVISALAEAAGLNVVYGELPQRRVTLRLTRPVAREEIPPLLRSTLESNGLRMIEEQGFIRIEAPVGAAVAPPQSPTGPDGGKGIRLFVHRLRHAQAPRLAATLQELFGGSSTNSTGNGEGAAMPLSQALRARQVLPSGMSPDAASAGTTPQTEGRQGEIGAMLEGPVQIVPDELTNSLLVRATDVDWQVVLSAIEALDLRPLQVLIEAHIVEVRHSSDFELSVSAGGSDRSRSRPNERVRGRLEGEDLGGVGLELVRVGPLDINVALSALSSRGSVRILSRPVITAQNNQEAHILIGSERPFIQIFRTLPTDNGARDQIVQYRDVGTSLTVKPTVSPDGYVNLQIAQEVSSATSEQQFGAPVISTREASTMLYVKDGQTAVIGGLIDRQQERSRGGIPLLKDIPLLGFLFGSTRRLDSYSELFLLLTPHVVASDEDLERVREGVEDATRKIREPLPSLQIESGATAGTDSPSAREGVPVPAPDPQTQPAQSGTSAGGKQ